jgi:ribonuclease P protein subunit POP4
MIQTGRISLHQKELIGLPISVAYSSNQSQVGVRGVVTDETRNTVTVATEAGAKMIGKRGACFAFQLADGSTETIEGAKILARPHERVTGRARG